MSRLKPHFLRLIALTVGVAVFYFTITSFGGWDDLWRQASGLSWRVYALVAFNCLLWSAAYTRAWQLLIGEEACVRFLDLFRIKLGGEAANFLTPAGFLIGDPVRAALLEKKSKTAPGAASVVIDRALHSLSAQAYCLAALVLLTTQNVPFPAWIGLPLLLIYGVTFLLIGGFVAAALSGRELALFDRGMAYFRVAERFPKAHARAESLRLELATYVGRPRAPILTAFGWHFLGRILGAVEIGGIHYFLTGRFAPEFAIILTALTSFVSVAGGFIPGAAGFLEALYAAFSKLYGFSPSAGVTIQLVRRLRVLFAIVLGLLFVDYDTVTKKGEG